MNTGQSGVLYISVIFTKNIFHHDKPVLPSSEFSVLQVTFYRRFSNRKSRNFSLELSCLAVALSQTRGLPSLSIISVVCVRLDGAERRQKKNSEQHLQSSISVDLDLDSRETLQDVELLRFPQIIKPWSQYKSFTA